MNSRGKSRFALLANRIVLSSGLLGITLICQNYKRVGGIILPQTVHMSLLVFEVDYYGCKCGYPKVIIRLPVTFPTRKSPHNVFLSWRTNSFHSIDY